MENTSSIYLSVLGDHKPFIKEQSTTYTSTWKQSTKFLDIDARGDRIYIHIEECMESGRTHNISLTISREVWNEYKKLIKEFDGSEI